jgi:hypothetical protein
VQWSREQLDQGTIEPLCERANRLALVEQRVVLRRFLAFDVLDVRETDGGHILKERSQAFERISLREIALQFRTADLDAGLPARGLNGEAYRGHVFWDEIYVFPYLNIRLPEVTRGLLLYRYRRLGEARAAALEAGFRGAMFPWQSGSEGIEETQRVHLNPLSGHWDRDLSHNQRHVNAAIFYNIWHYYQATDDVAFLRDYGAEVMLEIARFWASIAHFNPERGRYEIHGNQITLSGPRGQITLPFEIHGDTLTLTVNGVPVALNRVREEAGPGGIRRGPAVERIARRVDQVAGAGTNATTTSVAGECKTGNDLLFLPRVVCR